ncbi:MAG: DUF2207 domain-containing protein [Bacteroidia bacterium]|nr:DUF2207 domain-containing protein [Bacteroidia bacterium]
MRKFFAILAGLALGCTAASAYEPAIHDIDITVKLYDDGSALIHETWDVTVASGTEWYLVRNGLDGSTIEDFSVFDGDKEFYNEGDWDVDRGIAAKTWRCGIVRKSNGCELCWGVGNYGPHTFHAVYTLTGAVRAKDDYDYFHWQLITPGLSARPQHARVTILPGDSSSVQIDTSTTRAWGFGYDGEVMFTDSSVIFETDGLMGSSDSIIAMLAFRKGVFQPALVESGNFTDLLEIAQKGASYYDDYDDFDDEDLWEILCSAGVCLGLFLYLKFLLKGMFGYGKNKTKKVSRREKKKLLGQSPDDVLWTRELPFNGNLLCTEYVMKKLGEIDGGRSTLAAALILRMVYNGQIEASRDKDGKLEFRFNGDSTIFKDKMARQLYDFMKEASGSDVILQDKEFSSWSKTRSNQTKINKWLKECEKLAENFLDKEKALKYSKFTEKGQQYARECYGFKKFLSDFTLIKDKATVEVTLWQEYLVYASLFGMAEKVAKELKDINTELAEQVLVTGLDTTSMYDIIRMTNALSRSITHTPAQSFTSPYSTGSFGGSFGSGSRGGFGGHSSFGGGGGFHGGGFGGGSR